jgi:hypothetical protein
MQKLQIFDCNFYALYIIAIAAIAIVSNLLVKILFSGKIILVFE